jgi:hypothetical protein
VVQPGLRVYFTEITPETRVMRHPGAAATTGPPADDAGSKKIAEREKFWRRVVRLFGAS